jgi:acyl-CoA thioesterase I
LSVVCDTLKIPYLDVFTPLLASAVWLKEVELGDGAHPNAAGYAELAGLVRQWHVWQDWFRK